MTATSAMYSMIRPEIIDSLRRYVEHKIPTGGFLHAVLSNDLRDAIGRADGGNLQTLPAIVTYCYNELPATCWGTPERVQLWLETRKTT